MEDKFNYNVIVDELQPGYYDGHEILYTDKRIERSSIPTGMYLYELRGERNDISIPCEIRHSVLIRFSGSIITKEPLPMSEKGSLPIQDNDHQLLILNHLLDGIETDDEDEDIKQARVYLTYCTNVVLKEGAALLGIEMPERM